MTLLKADPCGSKTLSSQSKVGLMLSLYIIWIHRNMLVVTKMLIIRKTNNNNGLTVTQLMGLRCNGITMKVTQG